MDDDEEMNTPAITSLAVGNEPPNSHRPTPTPPWNAPFLQLLGLLKIIDNSKATPKVEDQRFCFQPSHDHSEISRIFLSVSTSNLRYDIDLTTIQVVGSDAVPQAVTELQEYANKVLRRNQEFRDRLLQRDLIKDPTRFFLVDMLTCAACLHPLISCLECDAKVACSNPACLASLVVDCEQCSTHKRVVCFDCLKQNETVAPLICCQMCETWCCREDVDWCAGLVVQPTLGSNELAELSHECEWDNKTIVRSHPPKPGPCRFCTDNELAPGWAACRNSINDMKPDRCPSQTPFMTDHLLRAAHCPDCLGSSPGYRCACGLSWLCDMCFAVGNKSVEYPFFVICPRCGVGYCTGPDSSCTDSIDFCPGCKGVILCKDCQEEEQLPRRIQTGHELPKQVVFTEQCSFCEAWSCGDCAASAGTARCLHCRKWFCHACITDPGCDIIRPCAICGGPICRDCRVEQRGCTRPMMFWVMMPPRPANF